MAGAPGPLRAFPSGNGGCHISWLVVALLGGCHGISGAPGGAGSAVSVPSAASPPRAPAASGDLRVEARRGTLTHFEPWLEPVRQAVVSHFGGAADPFPLMFQVVSGGQGRSAVLLQAASGEPRAMVFLLDDGGHVVWTKDHPLGGVKPGVSEPTLAAGPDAHVCLAWCNASTNSVALRRWAEDGGAFADYDALPVDGCDALSALYWPRRGWLLAVAPRLGAALQLVSENGSPVFGRDGMNLPWLFRAPSPVSLALDTPDTLLLFRLGQSGGAGSAEYIFASRFSVDGNPLWPGPASVKRLAAPVREPATRLVLTAAPDGAVRATLPAPAAGNTAVSVDVASDGAVVRR